MAVNEIINSIDSPLIVSEIHLIEEPENETDNYDNENNLTGIIDEIYCENFMCHKKLRVTLNQNINFITGENGSGKSAIIAAIQICLGSTAKSTHRGKSLKDLIRKGHDGKAIVRITLKNNGVDAYCPEIYGNSIIIERLISRDGVSEFRLKDFKNVLISKKRNDLESILDHLNIQVDNPCAVLDQENAKLFLKGDQQDKYKFFLKSTNLYKIKNIYNNIKSDLDGTQQPLLEKEKKKLLVLKKKKHQLKKRLIEAQQIEKLQSNYEEIVKKLAWSVVTDIEKKKDKCVSKLQQLKKSELLMSEEIDIDENKVLKLSGDQEKKMEIFEESKKQNEKLEKDLAALKKKQYDIVHPIENLKKKKKNLINNNIYRHEEKIKYLQNKKQYKIKVYEENKKNYIIEEKELQHNLQTKRKRLDFLLVQVDEAEKELDNNFNKEGNNEEQFYVELRKVQREKGILCEDMNSTLNKISSLRNQKENKLHAFGSKIPELQSLIKQNIRHFTVPPIGPVGMHVQLPDKNKDYAFSIELILKGVLQSYLVFNGKDKRLLENLKKQISCNDGNIIITKHTNTRYENLLLPSGDKAAASVAHLLNISNNSVFNALVDTASIEGKLIFRDRRTVESECILGERGKEKFAPNILEVYLQNGDRLIVRNGNRSYISHRLGNSSNRRGRIFLDDDNIDCNIREHNEKLSFLKRNQESIKCKEIELKEQLSKTILEKNSKKRKLEILTREKCELEADLNMISNKIKQKQNIEQDVLDFADLDEEIFERNKDIENTKAQIVEIDDQIAEISPELNDIETKISKLNKDMINSQNIVDDLHNKMLLIHNDLSLLKKNFLRKKNDKLNYENQITQWNIEIKKLEKEIDVAIQKATEISHDVNNVDNTTTNLARPLTTKPTEYYREKAADLKEKIEKEKKRLDLLDLNKLEFDYEEIRQNYKQKKDLVRLYQMNIDKIGAMLHDRISLYGALREKVGKITSQKFNKFMFIKDFAGQLKFQHDKEAIEITVLKLQNNLDSSPTKKRKHAKITDMKELSGGERSFTQVSLLLGLGDSIECPFRVMDEFDVFMDNINRDLTIQLLVQSAKRNKKIQFIFITPNDLSCIKHNDPMIKIMKLMPPRDKTLN